ncbi:MAG: MSMEG_4193 family putative phosphomutase [Chloroflexi bacterium]|nr:MAG: MSMEG_4193 family putative phosphomutase [Chloroflexota bacterium]
MTTTIILVRHGENDWVKKKRLAGWIPGVHLNENGRKQAQAAANRLADLTIHAVYSSPVTRCMETAVYIAETHQLPVIPLEDIGEVRYGKWEGKKIKKLAKKKAWGAVQFFPSRFQFPEGESLHQVQYRAVRALETLAAAHPKQTIVIVSHADLIKLILAHYLGVHMDLFQRIVISPASVSVLALFPNGGVRVLRLNDDGPLRLPAPEEDKKVTDEAPPKEKDGVDTST